MKIWPLAACAACICTPVDATIYTQSFYSDFLTHGTTIGSAVLPYVSGSITAVSIDFSSALTNGYGYGLPFTQNYAYTGFLGIEVDGNGSFSLTSPLAGSLTCTAGQVDCTLAVLEPFHYDLTSSQISALKGVGTFMVSATNIASVPGLSFIGGESSALGKITYTLSDPVGVPEASTWAMMVGGLGMAGTALRQRRRPTVRTI